MKVLYLALEDGPKRLKKRLQQQGWVPTTDVTFHTAWRPASKGGMDDLTEFVKVLQPRVIVIDTLSRFLGGQGNQNDVGEMTAVLSTLQKMAVDTETAILVIDHQRKKSNLTPWGDPVEDLLGSTAKAAVPDAVWGLYASPGKRAATFRAKGRDIEDTELTVAFDAGRWKLVQPSNDPTAFESKIIEAVKEKVKANATEVAKLFGADRGNVARAMARLAEKGLLKRLGQDEPGGPVWYAMPDGSKPTESGEMGAGP